MGNHWERLCKADNFKSLKNLYFFDICDNFWQSFIKGTNVKNNKLKF